MINIANRTEYSFRMATGTLAQVLEANKHQDIVGICDRFTTWGHIPFINACKQAGKTPFLGVELAVVNDCDLREKQPPVWVRLFALSPEGLRAIYETVTLSTEKKYYINRVDWPTIMNLPSSVLKIGGMGTPEKAIEEGDVYLALDPSCNFSWRQKILDKWPDRILPMSDNFYPTPEHLKAHQVIIGMRNYNMRLAPSHILSGEELGSWAKVDIKPHSSRLASILEAFSPFEIPKARMVSPEVEESLEEMCRKEADRIGLDLSEPTYAARLKRELDLIELKGFEDYFYVVADLVQYAKTKMFVGPARGSSCGSLVCYLLGITDVDPMPYDLLFERFIDLNREDYPDIDIDFADDKRDLVFKYLAKKYGRDCVAKLGTVSVFKAKSAITDVSKELMIPIWEVNELKDAIIERSGGDARAGYCIMDTFNDLDIGKETLKKYPELEVCAQVEGHSRHTGIHAAGILVTAEPIFNYAAVDEVAGCAMLDKYDSERLDMLKIDALGLRTLSVLQDALDQAGMSREDLKKWPMDDKKAFDVLNKNHFAGVFQFEGYALQSLAKRLDVDSFDDIANLTALGRPGPLNSGGATEYLARRNGTHPVSYLHDMAEWITKPTLGVIIYQEQVMQIAREIGGLSWEDVSTLRKAMSKSLGKEFFDTFWVRFLEGAKANNIGEDQAKVIWDNINTMGSWAFNRSHAVAYGMMSYWCLVMKAHYPLEFAAACLRHAKDDDQSIRILRELSTEGYEYEAFNKETSIENWSVANGKLIGGLRGIKGIGPKLAKDIIKRRKEGTPLTKRQETLLTEGETPWDYVWEATERWGHVYESPTSYNIASKLTLLGDVEEDFGGELVFIAKVTARDLRDHNEPLEVERRGGKVMTGQTKFLKLVVEDDTGSGRLTINRKRFKRLAHGLLEEGKIGDWYIFKGIKHAEFHTVQLTRWVKLTGNQKFNKVEK